MIVAKMIGLENELCNYLRACSLENIQVILCVMALEA